MVNTVTGQEEILVQKATQQDTMRYVLKEDSTSSNRRLLNENNLIIGDVYVEDDAYAMKLSKEITIQSENGKTILNLNISEIV